jgi:hypothetical protein
MHYRKISTFQIRARLRVNSNWIGLAPSSRDTIPKTTAKLELVSLLPVLLKSIVCSQDLSTVSKCLTLLLKTVSDIQFFE